MGLKSHRETLCLREQEQDEEEEACCEPKEQPKDTCLTNPIRQHSEGLGDEVGRSPGHRLLKKTYFQAENRAKIELKMELKYSREAGSLGSDA